MREKRKLIKYLNISFPSRAVIRRLFLLQTLCFFPLSNLRHNRQVRTFQSCCPVCRHLRAGRYGWPPFYRVLIDLGRHCLISLILAKKKKNAVNPKALTAS